MTLEFALFDLDDTLYPRDAIMPYIDARIEIFLRDTLNLTAENASAKRHYYNERYGSVIRGLLQEEVVDIDQYLDTIHDVSLEQYLQPNPALANILTAIPLYKYIFTNSYYKHAENVLAVLEINHCFEGIFDIQFVNYVSKPARQSYAAIVQALNTVPEACIFIDDKVKNVIESKLIGMRTILVDDQPNEQVDVVVDNILEIGDAIQQLLDRTV